MPDAVEYCLESNAAAGVGLRVEEDLGMEDILGAGLFQIGPGHVVKVLLGLQDGHALVVEVEEVLQLGELILGAQRLDRRVGQVDAVAFGEPKHGVRLDRPLDVQMQLGLRQAFNETCHDHLSNSMCCPLPFQSR
jgi:hypothetical protein